MGLTTTSRQPKDSFRAVQTAFATAPHFPLPRHPKVSVVVPSYNGDRTLKACLDSLQKLNYPDYEIILVDDGSVDTTGQIALAHPKIRYFHHEQNLGLSVARNTGIAAATGEIIAFTDSDCAPTKTGSIISSARSWAATSSPLGVQIFFLPKIRSLQRRSWSLPAGPPT